MSRFITRIKIFTVFALLLSGCNDKATDAPKTDTPKTAVPKADAPQADAPAEKPAPTGACDVTVTAGADAPAVELEEGKTYCIGDLRFTQETKLEDAREMLSDCDALANRGATLLQCKGVKLTFAGPVLYLARIEPTAS